MNGKKDRRKAYSYNICRRFGKIYPHRFVLHEIGNQINEGQKQNELAHDGNDNGAWGVSRDNTSNSNKEKVSEYNLEQSLEDILSKMSGVGKVDVLITYSQTSEVVAMYNEKYTSSSTEETDTNGGTRKIEETDTNKEIIFEGTKPAKLYRYKK